jgi:hypothetical protein
MGARVVVRLGAAFAMHLRLWIRTTLPPPQKAHRKIQLLISEIATFLEDRRARESVRSALERVFEVVKKFSLLAAIQDTKTIGAIESLQKAVDKLTTKIESEPRPTLQEAPTYASVARGRRPMGGPATTRLDISQKAVPARHKSEIIVRRERGFIDRRIYKEYLEHLNSEGMEGELVAMRSLPSGDLVLTTEDARTRTV